MASTINNKLPTMRLSPQPTSFTRCQLLSRNKPDPIIRSRYPKAGRKNRVLPSELVVRDVSHWLWIGDKATPAPMMIAHHLSDLLLEAITIR